MPIKVLGMDGNPVTTRDIDASPNNFVFTCNSLVFSGSYTTGGDTLDLSALAGIVPSASLPLSAFIEGNGPAASLSGAGGNYAFVTPAGVTLKTFLVKIFTHGGTEYSSGAYSTDVTTDVIAMQIIWRKLL